LAHVRIIEPDRPTIAQVHIELADHVRALAGPDAVPRPEQADAVAAIVAERRRTLLVARTGFGKSAVYFSATRMLRERGWGPTLVVSPLLALMRDQVAAARRLCLRADSICSADHREWDRVEAALDNNEVDLLLIAPERFANQGFRDRVFASLLQTPFALVCDEAHCISDWGHDFRPDYLRLRRLLDEVPPWTPVLATTATANSRVTEDVASQLGDDTLVLRTSLDRESLHLSVINLPDDATRWAWISHHLSELDGSGIIYTLTVSQADQLAQWLRDQGHAAAAYSGSTEPEHRITLEDQLRNNELKVLVATSALGMGFDKSDLAFCIHLGLPPTPVAYYQQMGRAGRGIDRAEVIALPRPGDDQAVWRWFEQVSLPPEDVCQNVLDQLSPTSATSTDHLETMVNLGRTRLQTLLSILDVHGAISKVKGGYIIADPGWRYDSLQAERLRRSRREEAEQMQAYGNLSTCRLSFLRQQLDDPDPRECGRCDVCVERHWEAPQALMVEAAQRSLRQGDITIEARRQWPSGLDGPKGRIAPQTQARTGRALSRVGDGGWSPLVSRYLGAEDVDRDLLGQLVTGILGVFKRWEWEDRPSWICPIPSRRHGSHIDAVAAEIGRLENLAIHNPLRNDESRGWQSDQANSAHQVANVWGPLSLDQTQLPTGAVRDGPVLLIDDEVDSRWTFTTAAYLLKTAQCGDVLPFALRRR